MVPNLIFNQKQLMKQVFVFALLSLLFVNCTKKLPTATTDYSDAQLNTIVAALDEQQLQFKTLETKANIDFKDDKNSMSFKATIRMQKDEQIWISGGLFGFEGVRAVITQDSVKVINRLQREYAIEPIEKLEEIAKLPINFNDFQQLLLGEILKWQPENSQVEELNGEFRIQSTTAQMINSILLSTANLDLKYQSLEDQVNNQILQIKLSDYDVLGNGTRFSKNRIIQVVGDETIDIELNFQSIDLNEDLNFPFSINDKYERIYY